MDNKELDLTHNDSTPNFPAIKDALIAIHSDGEQFDCGLTWQGGCGAAMHSPANMKVLNEIIEVLEGYY